jgi:putative membrane protein
MRPITREESQKIAAAITRAEKQTSGEIVVVVTPASAGYRSFALMCAALIALAVPIPFIYFTKWPIEHVYLVQLVVFLVVGAISQLEPVRVAIAPRFIKRARVHQRALEQFLAQDLHTTRSRTGVLIYASAAERIAEVIADEGIYKKVTPKVWDDVIAVLTSNIAKGTRAEGFIKAIEICGKVLAEHFPPHAIDKNELPNHLIVLDAPDA